MKMISGNKGQHGETDSRSLEDVLRILRQKLLDNTKNSLLSDAIMLESKIIDLLPTMDDNNRVGSDVKSSRRLFI